MKPENTTQPELFTGGEWKYNGHRILYSYSEKEPIATISCYSNVPEQKANGRLLVEAKNMYEALKDLAKVAAETTADLIAWDGADPLDDSIDRAKAIFSRIEKGK